MRARAPRLLGSFLPSAALGVVCVVTAARGDAVSAWLAAVTWIGFTVWALLDDERPTRSAANPEFLDAARRQLDQIREHEGERAARQIAKLFRHGYRTEPVPGLFKLLDQYIGEDEPL